MLTNKEIRAKAFALYKEKCFSLFIAFTATKIATVIIGFLVSYIMLKLGTTLSQTAIGGTMQAVTVFVTTPVYAGISWKLFQLWRGDDKNLGHEAFAFFSSFGLLLRFFARAIALAVVTVPVIAFMAIPLIAMNFYKGPAISYFIPMAFIAVFFIIGLLFIFVLSGIYMVAVYLLMLKPEVGLGASIAYSFRVMKKYWRKWLVFTLRTLIVPVLVLIASIFILAMAVLLLLRGHYIMDPNITRAIVLFIAEFFILTFYVMPYLMTAGAGYASEMLADYEDHAEPEKPVETAADEAPAEAEKPAEPAQEEEK
jgi:hypothetical protein